VLLAWNGADIDAAHLTVALITFVVAALNSADDRHLPGRRRTFGFSRTGRRRARREVTGMRALVRRRTFASDFADDLGQEVSRHGGEGPRAPSGVIYCDLSQPHVCLCAVGCAALSAAELVRHDSRTESR
jgi:hypothetical protein